MKAIGNSQERRQKVIEKPWDNHWKIKGESLEHHWEIIIFWGIPGYSPAYSRVSAGIVAGPESLRVLVYPGASWRILAESFGTSGKLAACYEAQPHPRNRASRFYVLTGS